jgi:hypothetical protein
MRSPLLNWLNLWGSESFHEGGNILILSVFDRERILVESSQLPVVVWHIKAFEFARLNTLTAVNTLVYIVMRDEAFGGAIDDYDLNRVRGTVFRAQITTCAFGWIEREFTAETNGGLGFFEGIFFRNRS